MDGPERLGKRIKPNELIRKASNNLNRIQSAKHCFTPNQFESLKNDEFADLYSFHWIIRVKEGKRRIET